MTKSYSTRPNNAPNDRASEPSQPALPGIGDLPRREPRGRRANPTRPFPGSLRRRVGIVPAVCS
jgi:hypothetical protein